MTDESSTSRLLRHVERGHVVSRRTVLFGAAGAVFLAACGNDSALLDETSSDGSSTTSTESASDTSVASADNADGATGAAAGEMVVSFTYTMSSEGKQVNPYIAVWLEDSNGDLVDTIAVWFLQGGKGTEWLSDLSAWYSDVTAAGADYSTFACGSSSRVRQAQSGCRSRRLPSAQRSGRCRSGRATPAPTPVIQATSTS